MPSVSRVRPAATLALTLAALAQPVVAAVGSGPATPTNVSTDWAPLDGPISPTGTTPTNPAGAPTGTLGLVFADEFDGSALDTTKWIHEFAGTRRDAFDTPDAVTVGDGHLTIKTYTDLGQHRTGVVSTRGKFERAFGYWEARIDYDSAPGMWSAFWVHSMGMPAIREDASKIDKPHETGNEIDVSEHRVRDRDGSDISNVVNAAVHWNGYGTYHRAQGVYSPSKDLDEGFHTYGLLWTPDAYHFYVDGEMYWTFTGSISSVPQFAILSSEVKNGGWSGLVPLGGYGSLEETTTLMKVDYVRVYNFVPSATTPEPATLSVLAAAAVVGLRRKR